MLEGHWEILTRIKKRVVNEQKNSQGQEQETHRSGEGVDEAGQEDEATAIPRRLNEKGEKLKGVDYFSKFRLAFQVNFEDPNHFFRL